MFNIIENFLIKRRWKKYMGDIPMDNKYWYIITENYIAEWSGKKWIKKDIVISEDKSGIMVTWSD